MFSLETFFVLSTQQRYGISGLHITTRPQHVYRYLDERGDRLVTVARPVLVFAFCNATVEKAMPMRLRVEWFTSRTGIATRRLFPECEWGTKEIEAYIGHIVADLRDNQLVKGNPREIHRSIS